MLQTHHNVSSIKGEWCCTSGSYNESTNITGGNHMMMLCSTQWWCSEQSHTAGWCAAAGQPRCLMQQWRLECDTIGVVSSVQFGGIICTKNQSSPPWPVHTSCWSGCSCLTIRVLDKTVAPSNSCMCSSWMATLKLGFDMTANPKPLLHMEVFQQRRKRDLRLRNMCVKSSQEDHYFSVSFEITSICKFGLVCLPKQNQNTNSMTPACTSNQ